MKKREIKKTGGLYKFFLTGNSHLFVFFLYGIFILIAYSSALNGTWAMDDVLLNKPVDINDIKNLIGFRKVTSLTFLINQAITPLNPAGFRLFNILLHVINSFLIYLISYKTMKILLNQQDQKGMKRSGGKGRSIITYEKIYTVSLLSGLVFGLHPININAVSYIVQRMAALSTLFCLLSLLCYIEANKSRGLKAPLLFGLCGLFIITGILSKENAIMIIPLILFYDFIFLSDLNGRVFLKRTYGFLIVATVSAAVASYILGLHVVFIDLISYVFNPDRPLSSKGWMAVDVYWTPLQHLLTEFRVVSRYIFLLFVPLPQFFVFDWWGYQISWNLITPLTTLLSVFFIFSLLIYAVLKIKRFPLLSFAILWYLIAISLESFFALGADLYFEHRNYLPVAGLFLGVIGQISFSVKGLMEGKRPLVIVVMISLLLGSLTFARNLVWKDSFTLWGDTLRKAPHNIRALKAIGNAYLRQLDLKNAETAYLKAVKESSIRKSAQMLDESIFALGIVYIYKGELAKLKELMNRYENLIESYRTRILKGYYLVLNEDFDSALSTLEQVNDAEGIYKAMLFTLRGDAYRSKGLLDRALEEYKRAIDVDFSWASAYHGIGAIYMIKRDVRRAEEYFRKSLQIEPDNVIVLSDMADLMLIKGEPDKAMSYAQKALSKNPPFYQPYLAKANVLLIEGREDEAEGFYRETLKKGAKDYTVLLNKARIYYLKGDQIKAAEYIARLKNLDSLPSRARELLRD